VRLPPVGASPLGAHDALVGHELGGRYRIEGPVGQGAMGGVYAATRLKDGARVAVKVLTYGDDDPVALRRFRREIEVCTRLKHPNLVAVTDFGATDDGIYFLVMELLEGEPLATLLANGRRLAPPLVRRIAAQCVSALEAVHAAGIVHRDLKPTNVFVTGGGEHPTVKILDFGLSKLGEAQTALTGKSAVLGALGYLSPEQASGRSAEVDDRADVYGLAAVVYRMLTGRAPFVGGSLAEICDRVIHADPPPPSSLAPLPPGVDAVLLRALAKRPEDRHPDVTAFGEDLTGALG
jgi:serine/threonine-protein kinase